jgi:hypothetical protein
MPFRELSSMSTEFPRFQTLPEHNFPQGRPVSEAAPLEDRHAIGHHHFLTLAPSHSDSANTAGVAADASNFGNCALKFNICHSSLLTTLANSISAHQHFLNINPANSRHESPPSFPAKDDEKELPFQFSTESEVIDAVSPAQYTRPSSEKNSRRGCGCTGKATGWFHGQ